MPNLGVAEGPLLLAHSQRAWYSASIVDFLASDPNAILGSLTKNSQFGVDQTQATAWIEQIAFLQGALTGLVGSIFLEFVIPRMGKRVDVVLLLGLAAFAVEFKVGQSAFDAASLDQVWDYALDLKNFHKGSHAIPIIPVLVATEAKKTPEPRLTKAEDDVFEPLQTNNAGFRSLVDTVRATLNQGSVDATNWATAPYEPTPTIIEAARALYARHSVDDISRRDAGARNLRVTSRRIEEILEEAKTSRRKAICFVTGVPGAGKTLVGLNVATRHRQRDEPTHAVFLSGNDPLVRVLREALIRDEARRLKKKKGSIRRSEIGESIKSFIQNVHHFRDEALIDEAPPHEHVAIFDEAQRAWDLKQTAFFMARKKGRPGFEHSEPEFLLSYMDRHRDWAVVICLVGGGQEINRGEAGIDTWLDAVIKRFSHWDVHISSHLTDSEYGAGHALERIHNRPQTFFDDALHLSASMRSFRAERVSHFVKALLDCDQTSATELLRKVCKRYPIAVTRDLGRAKQWVREKARGSERYGLLASSSAQRLKPDAIDVRVSPNPVHWFLSGKTDTRSSYFLEDAATEFQVQGLEVDWACVTWDADFRKSDTNCWSYHDFRGTKWNNVGVRQNQIYLRNAYRVLLTRARQGMVIYIPVGDEEDKTRNPRWYDATFKYLESLGIPVL